MPSDMVQAIGDLIKSGNADNEPTQLKAEPIEVVEVYNEFKHLFNNKARRTLNNRVHSLLHQYNQPMDETARLFVILGKLGIESAKRQMSLGNLNFIRKFDVMYFFGSRASREKVGDALTKVINAINIVADLGYTKSSLLPLGILKIRELPPSTLEDFIVVSYITLTEEGKNYVDSCDLKNMLFAEGGVPKYVENQ